MHLRAARMLLIALLTGSAVAHSEYRSKIPNGEIVSGVRALGHNQFKGGGALNPFGKAFRKAKYKWTRSLCMADSDEDGESNGLELGDPCCLWREGGPPPQRSWRLSHPGLSMLKARHRLGGGVSWRSGIAMPNCTQAAAVMLEAELTRARASIAARREHDLRTITTDDFKKFYFTNTFYDVNQAAHVEPATAAMLVVLVACALITWREARAQARTTSARPPKAVDGDAGFTSSSLLRTRHALATAVLYVLLLLLVVIYVDMVSGLLHIVLDNPLFTTWPLIGPGAVGFQRHHHHPAGITVSNLFAFVQEGYPGLVLIAATGLVPCKYSAGSVGRTATLRLFLAATMLLSALMMACHRWSHMEPERLSPLITRLQREGYILNHEQHSLHHVDYNMNFCIFTGWVNPTLNALTANVLHEHSRFWLGALLLWVFTPLLCARGLAWLIPPTMPSALEFASSLELQGLDMARDESHIHGTALR